jgi:two-component system OmpR family response regulator
MRILIVDDDIKLADALMTGLVKKGYAVDVINEGETAFKRISLNHMDYDLIILDLSLPGMDGASITKKMRDAGIITPVLILTAHNETERKIDLLLTGADDYLVKPFSFDELTARMRAILRRPPETVPSILTVAGITLDPIKHTVLKNGKPLSLTLKEFVLLEYFMRHPHKVVNREELLTHLWDFNYSSFSNVVDVHIKNLRKKLGITNGEKILETIRGLGYRFAA